MLYLMSLIFGGDLKAKAQLVKYGISKNVLAHLKKSCNHAQGGGTFPV
jgi:hypothetical protein